MPMRLATSSADNPEPRRNAFRRCPMSSKRGGIWRLVDSSGRSAERPKISGSGLLGFQALRRIQRGIDNALIAGAAAEIAGDRDADLPLRGVGIVAQEFEQCRQHARRAEAALQAVIVAK